MKQWILIFIVFLTSARIARAGPSFTDTQNGDTVSCEWGKWKTRLFSRDQYTVVCDEKRVGYKHYDRCPHPIYEDYWREEQSICYNDDKNRKAIGGKWVASVGAKCWILKCENDEEFYQGQNGKIDFTKCAPCEVIKLSIDTSDPTVISFTTSGP
jgi:hypothetical protein